MRRKIVFRGEEGEFRGGRVGEFDDGALLDGVGDVEVDAHYEDAKGESRLRRPR